MLEWEGFTLFLYILARMSGFVLFNPLLGRQSIPGLFRGGMTLVLAAFTYSITDQTVSVPSGTIGLAIVLLLELLIGFLLGMVIQFFFYIPQLAGLIVDTQMGMTMNQIYDAASQGNLSVTSQLLNALMILLFFAGNGHHTLMRILLTSGSIVNYGAVFVGEQVWSLLLELFVQCTLMGVKLCLPILAAELLGQLGMGILMKVIPQINVFSINIELKVIIGIGLLLLFISPFSEFLLKVESGMLSSLSQVLRTIG